MREVLDHLRQRIAHDGLLQNWVLAETSVEALRSVARHEDKGDAAFRELLGDRIDLFLTEVDVQDGGIQSTGQGVTRGREAKALSWSTMVFMGTCDAIAAPSGTFFRQADQRERLAKSSRSTKAAPGIGPAPLLRQALGLPRSGIFAMSAAQCPGGTFAAIARSPIERFSVRID